MRFQLRDVTWNHIFVFVPAPPFLGAEQPNFAALGIGVQHPGDLGHRPERRLSAIHISVALGNAHVDRALNPGTEYALVAIGRPAQNHTARAGIAQSWRVDGSGSLKHFDLSHIPFHWLIDRTGDARRHLSHRMETGRREKLADRSGYLKAARMGRLFIATKISIVSD